MSTALKKEGFMSTKARDTGFIAAGLILGTIIGLGLDIYELNVFGDIGLGIVFCPMIGILISTVLTYFSRRRNDRQKEKETSVL